VNYARFFNYYMCFNMVCKDKIRADTGRCGTPFKKSYMFPHRSAINSRLYRFGFSLNRSGNTPTAVGGL